MDAKERKIHEVINEKRIYSIPAYQRPYSWGEENTLELLQDVYDAFSNEEDEYFIGSIITIEKKRDEEYEVVDGQQRLTTLNIIFSALRDSFEKDNLRRRQQQRILPQDDYTDEPSTPRLEVRPQDRTLFYEAVLRGSQPSDLADLSETQLNFVKNRRVALDYLSALTQEELAKFAKYIEDNVYLVVVSTSSFESAFRLFNVLNARGMPLSNGDLIKNLLFTQAQDSKIAQGKVEECWNNLEELIGISELDYFLGHFRTSVRGNKAQEVLHKEYQALMKDLKLAPEAFAAMLVRSAKSYIKIKENDFSEVSVKRLIIALQNVSHDEWLPPLMAFTEFGAADMPLVEYVTLLEKITMQNWVRRLGRTKRVTVYYRLINHLRTKGSKEGLRAIFNEFADNADFRKLIESDCYGTPYAKAVLLRLEQDMQDESVTKVFSGLISVEHVLPQKPADEYWQKRFTTEDRSKWVHKLGNLALLSGRKNSAAQNYDFNKKKKIFQERGAKVSFDLTKEVCQAQEWNVDVVQSRQQKLVQRAVQIWTI